MDMSKFTKTCMKCVIDRKRQVILIALLAAAALTPEASVKEPSACASTEVDGTIFGRATFPGISGDTCRYEVVTAALTADECVADRKARSGVTVKGWGNGSGTEDDPWLIEAYNELVNILMAGGEADNYFIISSTYGDFTQDMPNEEKYIDLTPEFIGENQDLSFVAGYPVMCDIFCGHLDGNGFTIYLGTRDVGYDSDGDAQDYCGFFCRTLGVNSSISNFTVEGDITLVGNFCGPLIGKCYGDVDNVVSKVNVTQDKNAQNCGGLIGYTAAGTIRNCYYDGTFTTSGTSSGGLIGQAYKTTITDCHNEGTITAPEDLTTRITYTGGVVGYAHQSTITECFNVGTISTLAYGSGGVAGYVGDNSVISDCYNRRTVTSTGENLGGVVGRLIKSEMIGCWNEGEVSSTGANAAGVLSYAYYSTVSGCWNQEEVSASKTGVAGVVSYLSHSTITDCWNEGSVTGTSYYVGGVVHMLESSTMTGCYNNPSGDVQMNLTSDNDLGSSGGVTAAIDTTSTMTNCYNEGTFTTVDGNFCGGVVGFVNNMEGNTVSGCYNTGTVTLGQSFSGGVVGYLGVGAAAENCYNTGTIKITNPYCAGVVGRTAGGTITGCYSKRGTITTSNSAVAGVLGYGYAATVTDCWNSTNISTNGNSSGGVVGMVHSSSTISGCYNLGTVKSPKSETSSVANSFYIGGVVGRIEGGNDGDNGDSTNVVTNCWNAGDVYGGGYDNYAGVGGIVGYTFFAGDKISNCFNVGNITSYLINAGGIVGWCKADVSDVYSMGTITSSGGYAGGLVGNATSDCTISNGYFAGTVTADSEAGYIVGGYNGETASGDTETNYGKVGDEDTDDEDTDDEDTDDGDTGNTATGFDGSTQLTNTYYLKANTISSEVYTTTIDDEVSVGLSYAELAALDMDAGYTSGSGDDGVSTASDDDDSSTSAWTSTDDYSYPILSALSDNDYALAYSAAVIPMDENNTYSEITNNVYLGGSASGTVTWTDDADDETFWIWSSDGETSIGYYPTAGSSTVTVTATSGDVSVSTTLTADIATGVETIENGLSDAGREIVDEEYYTTSGARVAQPSDGAKAIYIVRRVYDDGTVTATKEAR